jgi:endonuclease YncB( thermonuclease family)
MSRLSVQAGPQNDIGFRFSSDPIIPTWNHDTCGGILDVDAPERGQLCFRKLQSKDEGAWPCGLQAALALAVTAQETTDLFKFWPARCAVAGQDVAEWLAARGWAVPDRRCKCDAIRDAAHNARAAQLTIWTSAFTMPWEWRAAH